MRRLLLRLKCMRWSVSLGLDMLMPDPLNAAIGVGRIGPIRAGVASEAPPIPVMAWSPFTMTAGDTGDWIGYTSGDLASPPFNPPEGLISNQPNNLHDLTALYNEEATGDLVVMFHGDIRSDVEGLKVTIDAYEGTAFASEMYAGNTLIRFMPPFGRFNDKDTYGIVFEGS